MNQERSHKLRWLRLKPNRFGSLDQELHFDPTRLTIIMGRNEIGKSTFVSALLSALYGIASRTRKNDPRPKKEDFTPWVDGPFTVELELTLNDRTLTVLRDLENGKLGVYDHNQTNCTSEYQASRGKDKLGEVLTGGLSPGAFLRSFVISQEQASLLANPGDLVEKIQSIVSASPGDTTTRAAQDLLQKSLDHVHVEGLFKAPVKSASARDKLEQTIRQKEETIRELKGRMQAASEIQSEFKDNLQKKQELQVTIKRLQKGILLEKQRELVRRKDKAGNAVKNIKDLERRIHNLEEYRSFPLQDQQRFEEAYAQYREAAHHAEQAARQADEKRNEYTFASKKLEDFEGLTDLDLDETEEFLNELNQWITNDRDREIKERDLDRERSELAAKGVFARRLEQVREKISQWPHDIEEVFGNLKKELDEADRYRQTVDENYQKYQLKKGGIRPKSAVSVIAIVAFLAALGAGLEWRVFENDKNMFIALICSAGALGLVSIYFIYEIVNHLFRRAKLGRLLSQSKNEYQKKQDLLQEYVNSLGEDSPEEVEKLLQDYRKLFGQGDRYFEIRAQWQQTLQTLDTITQSIHPLLEQSGLLGPDDTPTRGDIEGYITRIRQFRRILVDMTKIDTGLEQAVSAAENAAERTADLWNELKILFNAAGIRLGDEAEKAASEYRDAASKAARLHQLEDDLGRLKNDANDEDAVDKMDQRLEEYAVSIENLADVEPETGTLDILQKRYEENQAELRDLEKELSNTRTHYAHELEILPRKITEEKQELTLLQKRSEGLEIYTNAASLALDTIREVEEEVFGNAADMLNKHLEPVLQHLMPRWSNASFDEDLHLTVKDAETGKKLSSSDLEMVLSAGARDALFMGARFALTDFLTGGLVQAPHILDEPYAHFDDPRFNEGMNLLLERVREGSQVILMTCHHMRHNEWIKTLNEEARSLVHVLDLEEGK